MSHADGHSVLLQMLTELKQRSLANSEKEEKMEVKKKTIDLLPDADNNLVQLQVGPVSSQGCEDGGRGVSSSSL